MIIRVEVALDRRLPDPRGEGLIQDAAGLGVVGVASIRTADLAFLEGELGAQDIERLCAELLSDPVTQVIHWRRLDGELAPDENSHPEPGGVWIVEVGLLPGVTDPVADQIRYGAHLLGVAGLKRAATGQRYIIKALTPTPLSPSLGRGGTEGEGQGLDEAGVHRLAQRLLCNQAIQHYRLGPLQPHFPQPAAPRADVELIDLNGLDDDALQALSSRRLLSLDIAEMAAIRDHFAALGRPLSDVELETLAQTWSEHCIHKTFKALITLRPSPPIPPSPSLRRGGETVQPHALSLSSGREGEGDEGRPPEPSQALIERARQLRQQATSAEQLLWELLRSRQLLGRRFRRQYPLGRFITDFFCDDARLVIEIDGGVHQEPSQRERDRARDEVLRKYGYDLLHFTNHQVLSQTGEVLQYIAAFVREHTSERPSPPQPPSLPSTGLEPGLGERGGEKGKGRSPLSQGFGGVGQEGESQSPPLSQRGRGGQGGEGELLIDGLLRTFIRAATEKVARPWVRSAFVDNAGIIDFDDEYEVSFKIETHNHPSALEPFGGANTGIGGVVRDILGVSARPIATTDVLCFGPQDLNFDDLPPGMLHPRRIMSGVVAGIQDYGNKLGLPTVSGAILFDPGYTANPLVYCGCVGIAPKGRHPRQARPGDRVVVIGGRTGRDGLHGATFSSTALTHETGVIAGSAVQIGDPITEKGALEVVVAARDEGLYTAITDCGAGGLSSAIGEMAARTGVEVQLEDVPLKYPGLAPWEIWLSEAQERMVLAVPPQKLPPLRDLCARFDVELRDLGQFTDSGRLVVRYGERVVADLDLDFLHGGLPRRRMTAMWTDDRRQTMDRRPPSVVRRLPSALYALLAHPDIASKEAVIRRYDHEVQAGTVVKPLTGRWNDGPSDAAVLKPLGTAGWRGLALACGINPQYGKLDPYSMAVSAVDEAIRNAVAVGADPDRIALLDNFCWGNPNRPERLGELVRTAQGCYDAAVAYGTPFISGKDSLNNEYLGLDGQPRSIPGTLLISSLGIVPDVRRCVTLDLKAPGDLLFVVGETRAELGGSHAYLVQGVEGGTPPGLPPAGPATVRALAQAIQAGLVRACHDCSEGGLAVAVAEMAIAGGYGLALDLERIPHAPEAASQDVLLFSESNGRLIVEVRPEDAWAFESLLAMVPCQRVGTVLEAPAVEVAHEGKVIVRAEMEELRMAWHAA